MDDKQIMANIDELIETEHPLRQQLAAGELSAPEEDERLRSAGEAPGQVGVRSARQGAGRAGGAASPRGAAGGLRPAEESLDQCWALLRRRRARRDFGENPD